MAQYNSSSPAPLDAVDDMRQVLLEDQVEDKGTAPAGATRDHGNQYNAFESDTDMSLPGLEPARHSSMSKNASPGGPAATALASKEEQEITRNAHLVGVPPLLSLSAALASVPCAAMVCTHVQRAGGSMARGTVANMNH